jgi:hypothetical protein
MWRSGDNQGDEKIPEPVRVNVLGLRIDLHVASVTPVSSNRHSLFGSEIHASPCIFTTVA